MGFGEKGGLTCLLVVPHTHWTEGVPPLLLLFSLYICVGGERDSCCGERGFR